MRLVNPTSVSAHGSSRSVGDSTDAKAPRPYAPTAPAARGRSGLGSRWRRCPGRGTTRKSAAGDGSPSRGRSLDRGQGEGEIDRAGSLNKSADGRAFQTPRPAGCVLSHQSDMLDPRARAQLFSLANDNTKQSQEMGPPDCHGVGRDRGGMESDRSREFLVSSAVACRSDDARLAASGSFAMAQPACCVVKRNR